MFFGGLLNGWMEVYFGVYVVNYSVLKMWFILCLIFNDLNDLNMVDIWLIVDF